MRAQISFSLPKSTKQVLEQLAKEKGISLEQLVRDYLAQGMLVENALNKGGELVLIKPSEKLE